MDTVTVAHIYRLNFSGFQTGHLQPGVLWLQADPEGNIDHQHRGVI